MAASEPVRLLVAEDVPQVADYIRDLVRSQTSIALVDVVSEGSHVAERIDRLRPDVVLVDLLLRGRVKGHAVVEQIRRSGVDVGVIVMTVPQHPVRADP